jgi:hypothetical protein
MGNGTTSRFNSAPFGSIVSQCSAFPARGRNPMSDKTNDKDEDRSEEKAAVTLPGTVEKIIPSITPNEPEKAQISVEGAEHLYKEIRVENTLQDESGNEVALKKGAKVNVTIEANPEATKPKE